MPDLLSREKRCQTVPFAKCVIPLAVCQLLQAISSHGDGDWQVWCDVMHCLEHSAEIELTTSAIKQWWSGLCSSHVCTCVSCIHFLSDNNLVCCLKFYNKVVPSRCSKELRQKRLQRVVFFCELNMQLSSQHHRTVSYHQLNSCAAAWTKQAVDSVLPTKYNSWLRAQPLHKLNCLGCHYQTRQIFNTWSIHILTLADIEKHNRDWEGHKCGNGSAEYKNI